MKHQRSKYLRNTLTALMVSVGILSSCRSAIAQSTNPPNILIIIADDLGTDKIGAYGEGDVDTRPNTPNIDALANSGILFKNAYSYSTCSPTRASILTGRQAFRTGIGKAVAPDSDYTIRDYPDEVPLPKLFSLDNSGYSTAHFGKWHLSIKDNDPDNHPTNVGFDHSSGHHENLSNENLSNYYSFDKIVNGATESVSEYYATLDTLSDAKSHINSTTDPWLVWVAFHAPHEPFHEPPLNMYTTEITDDSDTQLYRSAVEAMDEAIGQLVKDIPENTVIFFLGDNGSPGKVTVAPFESDKAKGTLYEGGINIPFIVAGSAVDSSQYGQTSDALVHVMDIYATAAELAGVDIDSNIPAGHVIDSVSFVDVLADASSLGDRRNLTAEIFAPNGLRGYNGLRDYTQQSRTIRNRNFKLIQDVTNNTTEFYRISNAPDGLDGTNLCSCPDNNLCSCPDNLSGQPLKEYNRLLSNLEDMNND